MVAQNTRPQPWLKQMDAQVTFIGGLNTVDDQTKMLNSELVQLKNMDIGVRGSLSRRHGMVNHRRKAIWGDMNGKTWGDLNA